jgi:Tfp pilus assembly protein FimT
MGALEETMGDQTAYDIDPPDRFGRSNRTGCRRVRRRNSERAFSLVELIITMQFMALAGLIAAPKMSTFFAEYQLQAGSRQVGFEIARARMQAIAQHRYVRIKMVSSTQYARQTSSDGSSWTNELTTKLPSKVTASTTSAEVRFDKRGIATVNNSVILTNGISQVKTVATNMVGRITIAG